MNTERRKLDLKEFDIQSMKLDRKVVVIGKPGCGKSTVIKDLLYQHRNHLAKGVVISGTEDVNEAYQGLVPNLYIYNELDDKVLRFLLAWQKRLCRKWKKCPATSAFIVLDDIMDKNSWKRDESVLTLFKNGRHYNIFALLACQYALDLPPDLRSAVDYIFILKENLNESRKKLHKYWCSSIDYNSFCKILDTVTQDWRCLVIDNTVPANSLEERFFWYKATPGRDFSIGVDLYWDFHDSHYNEHYQSDEEADELFALSGKVSKKHENRISVVLHP